MPDGAVLLVGLTVCLLLLFAVTHCLQRLPSAPAELQLLLPPLHGCKPLPHSLSVELEQHGLSSPLHLVCLQATQLLMLSGD